MLRDPNDLDRFGKRSVNILACDGGLGDMICALVAINDNIINCPYINWLIWVPDYLLEFSKHVLPKGAIIRNFTQAQKKYNDKIPGVSTRWQGIHSPQRTHPVDYAFHQLSDKHYYDLNKKNYLQIRPNEIDISRYNLPKKYVVIMGTASERVKMMESTCVDEISNYVISKGYTPVYMGKTVAQTGVDGSAIGAAVIKADYTKGINLLDVTTTLETAKIMHESAVVVGIDGGAIHIAGCTDTNIVAAYTFASPDHLAPIRKGSQTYKFHAIVPPESLKCRFCQSNINYLYNFDMRDCIYDDYKCIKEIKAYMFIEHLEKIL